MEVGLLLRDYADGKIDRSEAEKRLQATVDSGGIVLNRIDALKRGIPADTAQAPAAVLDDTKAGVRRIGVDNIV